MRRCGGRDHLRRLLAPLCIALLGPDPSPERQKRPQVGLPRDHTLPKLGLEPAPEPLIHLQLPLVTHLLFPQTLERPLLGQKPVAQRLDQLLVAYLPLGGRLLRPREQRLAPHLRDGVNLPLRPSLTRHRPVLHQPRLLKARERRVDAAVPDGKEVAGLPCHPPAQVVAGPGLAQEPRQYHVVERLPRCHLVPPEKSPKLQYV